MTLQKPIVPPVTWFQRHVWQCPITVIVHYGDAKDRLERRLVETRKGRTCICRFKLSCCEISENARTKYKGVRRDRVFLCKNQIGKVITITVIALFDELLDKLTFHFHLWNSLRKWPEISLPVEIYRSLDWTDILPWFQIVQVPWWSP